MYNIYGKLGPDGKIHNAGHQDVHAATAFGTFYQPVNRQVIEAEDSNGKKWVFDLEMKMKVKRLNIDGTTTETIVKGSQVDSSDEIIGYA